MKKKTVEALAGLGITGVVIGTLVALGKQASTGSGSTGSGTGTSGNLSTYTCAVCGLQFSTQEALTEHENLHSTPPPAQVFTCTVEGLTFSTEAELLAHQATHQVVASVWDENFFKGVVDNYYAPTYDHYWNSRVTADIDFSPQMLGIPEGSRIPNKIYSNPSQLTYLINNLSTVMPTVNFSHVTLSKDHRAVLIYTNSNIWHLLYNPNPI